MDLKQAFNQLKLRLQKPELAQNVNPVPGGIWGPDAVYAKDELQYRMFDAGFTEDICHKDFRLECRHIWGKEEYTLHGSEEALKTVL